MLGLHCFAPNARHTRKACRAMRNPKTVKEFEHTCIKPGCGLKYIDTDPDDYYCPKCNEARKEIARQLDIKRASLPKPQVKPRFSPQDFKGKNGRIFFNANELV